MAFSCALVLACPFPVLLAAELRGKYSNVLSRQNVVPFLTVTFFVLLGVCYFLHQQVPQVYG